MSSDHESFFAGVQAEAARLKADIASLTQLRWRLAWLEASAAMRCLRRLVVVLAAAALAALVALPILLVALADALDGRLGIPRWGWLLAFGLGLPFTTALAAWAHWHRFRREFVGFERTREEFREDAVWLRERITKSEHP